MNGGPATLRMRRLGIDTCQENVAYLHADSEVCRSEGLGARARIEVWRGHQHIVATLNVVVAPLLAGDEIGLSEAAWLALDGEEGATVLVTHAPPTQSFAAVRSKIYGRPFAAGALDSVIADLCAGRYADIEVATFISACAGNRLDLAESVALTRAMLGAGQRLKWDHPIVVDKHCVGGLPGNRTTLIVVPIVAACGLLMPKTSSRAITSPAGSADVMETLAPVMLTPARLQEVVEREGGCVAWGGAVALSPADDLLIRIERPLALDSEGLMVASILSKKLAAGATHVLIDIPVGRTAKVRSAEQAARLSARLVDAGTALGLVIETVVSDGGQPVGFGIGPALEAQDVLAVLQRTAGAPADLRERALLLAGRVLEMGARAAPGQGLALATAVLDSGMAWAKFEAICAAQGGLRTPPTAPHQQTIVAQHGGRVVAVDNQALALVAKLAGAPATPAAGVRWHTRLGASISAGDPLLTLYAGSAGQLAYAAAYAQKQAQDHLITVEQSSGARA